LLRPGSAGVTLRKSKIRYARHLPIASHFCRNCQKPIPGLPFSLSIPVSTPAYWLGQLRFR